MNNKKLGLMLLAAGFLGLNLDAKKIFLMAGKNQVSVIDNEDESTHCVFGISFDEREERLLAITFDTNPMTTCYIGQQTWQQMLEAPSNIREKWLENGLDPAGRKVKSVQLFKRIEQSPDSYGLLEDINLLPANPDAHERRARIIGMQAPPLFRETYQ